MGKNALVLGGGGVLGISWEIGVLAGLAEKEIDVTQADFIVGTSAGSVVGTQIARGRTLDDLVEREMTGTGGLEVTLDFDLAGFLSLVGQWGQTTVMTPDRCAEIGALALKARTMPEEQWLSTFVELEAEAWPARQLAVTAVDAVTGEFQVWNRTTHADLMRAVASSCTVPGLFPAVEISGKKYIDGGVRSGTNADLAASYDTVLMIAPIGSRSDGIDPLLGKQARAEAKALKAMGVRVELVFPDESSVEAIGINRMDSARRSIATEAGIAQGKAIADVLGAAWTPAAA